MRPEPSKARKPKVVASKWRMEDLPADLQQELRERLEKAKRGEDLHDFDDAVASADRMADEILGVTNSRNPTE